MVNIVSFVYLFNFHDANNPFYTICDPPKILWTLVSKNGFSVNIFPKMCFGEFCDSVSTRYF